MVSRIQNAKFKMQNFGIRRWRMIFLSFVFLFAGCVAQNRSCPPIATAQEATAILQEYSASLKPLKATGSCVMNYTDQEGKKVSQSFSIRIWFVSSAKFCLYGDVAFDPKGMSFAMDGDKYWVYAKPFGVFTTGRISKGNEDYFSSPAVFLDFLEPAGAGCDSLYMTQADKENNILVCRDNQRCITKKIFIDRCKQLVKKLEYLNCSGNPVVAIELDEYKNITGRRNFVFPRKLTYRYFRGQENVDKRQIKLDSVKLWQPQPQQLKALFSPPDANSIQKESK
jgi:hypothetical protein